MRDIGDLPLTLEQGEHLVQIGEALFDLAVNHAQKIQRNVELNHERIDHHQIPKRHAAIHHPLCGPVEHPHQGHCNDQLLPRVEQTQGRLRFESCHSQLVQTLVVALGLKGFVVEVFHRLVIEQRVHGSGVRHGVQLVDLFSKVRSPLRDLDREHDVKHQRKKGDHGKPSVVAVGQNGQHQHHFNQGGDNAVQGIRDQGLDAPHAPFNVPGHAPSLALQVKAQTQAVQVIKGLQGDLPGRTLRGFGKDQLSQLRKTGDRQPQQPVGQKKRKRHHQKGDALGLLGVCVGHMGRHRVDQLFEHQGHAHIGQFRAHHEGQGQDHPNFVGPQVGQQTL